MAIIPVCLSNNDETASDSEMKNGELDGNVLWQIFDESHNPADKTIKPSETGKLKHQKRYIINAHAGRYIHNDWLFGVGGEIKLCNIVFPVAMSSNFFISKNKPLKNDLLNLGIGVHFPGNLFSSNAGAGFIRYVFIKDKVSYYGLIGIEVLNIVYGEYMAIKRKPDIIKLGLRFYI